MKIEDFLIGSSTEQPSVAKDNESRKRYEPLEKLRFSDHSGSVRFTPNEGFTDSETDDSTISMGMYENIDFIPEPTIFTPLNM